ncbi:hypothetical protein [Pseudomonas kuykendallii]|uniref:hypothetical protein n=1 Tax=Pseudomonas kuykendallii TaxID=1007099 RepID=UPI0028D61810|nr:hypothetical protein [Pseudomonas kuykendallii]
MAIYTLKGGVYSKVAEDISEMLPVEMVAWEDWDALMRQLGFIRYDEVSGGYRLWMRTHGSMERHDKTMLGCKYMFDVDLDEETLNLVLVDDNLPDFLMMMRELQPLVLRGEALEREMAKGHRGRS